ncbi:MAG: VanZ family protein [Ruminococcaceae bacterium]|nr:VanZ family protein [Oscillospiraceae bacterium]
MQTKNTMVIKAAFLILILATLGFIFSQSMLPPEKSEQQSNSVGEIVAEVIPPDTKPGEFVQINLRKLAHFFEFAVLGIELSVYAFVFKRRKGFMLSTYIFAVFVALFDETIQIFSGRGSSIFDVWIDFFGFAAAASLVYLIGFSVIFIRGKWCKNG